MSKVLERKFGVKVVTNINFDTLMCKECGERYGGHYETECPPEKERKKAVLLSAGLGGANLKEDKKMDIPGITAKHKIVTRDCRKRPIGEIKAETVDELWQEFEELNETWPKDADVKFRFILLVER